MDFLSAKERLKRLQGDAFDIDKDRPSEVLAYQGRIDRAKIQALIEIREALDKQTMALDRLTEEVRAGRNKTI